MEADFSIRVPVDAVRMTRQMQASDGQAGLLGKLASRRLFGGLSQMLRAAREAPGPLGRRIAALDQQDSVVPQDDDTDAGRLDVSGIRGASSARLSGGSKDCFLARKQQKTSGKR